MYSSEVADRGDGTPLGTLGKLTEAMRCWMRTAPSMARRTLLASTEMVEIVGERRAGATGGDDQHLAERVRMPRTPRPRFKGDAAGTEP